MQKFANYITLSLVVAAMMLVPYANAQDATFTAPKEIQAVPGEYIVKFRDEGVMMAAQSLLQERGVETVQTLGLISAKVIRLDPQAEISALNQAIAGLPNVEYVEPNYLYYATETPNDSRYSDQWAWPKIDAPKAWDVLTDSPNVVVAVIDTGVDYKHPELKANMWKNPGEIPANNKDDDNNGIVDDVHGANFVPTTPSGDPMDDNRHGTHVAGTIGAVTNNSLGVAGTTWRTQIMAMKFLSASGSGSTANAVRAIEYAIAKGAHIMNNSWGGGGFSRALEDAIKAADAKGILFAAAAGNSGTDNDQRPHYPSNYDVPNVIAVMATDRNDQMPSFTCFGQKTVDLAAPGADILSTVPGGNYASFNGTSMATPHVSGAAALLKAQDSSRIAPQIKKLLMDTVDKIPVLAGKNVTGGRLNLGSALVAVPTCTGSALIAYDEFFWPEKRSFDTNANVLSVEFTLPQEMIVDVFVHGSANRTKGNGVTTFRTGVYNSASPNVMWTGSYRRGSYRANNVSRTVSSQFSIRLPKGKHTMYWKLWLSNFTMQFDSANIVVRGFPCSMGGKLAAVTAGGQAAASAPIMMADTGSESSRVGRVEQPSTTPSFESTEIDPATGESLTIMK
jgi:subtilisin family serine protease